MRGEFVIIVDGKLQTFTDYNNIPNKFDHVISFKPEIIPGPHSEEEHTEIDTWNEKLQRLMEIENASRNSKR